MSRTIINVLGAILAVACVVVIGSTVAWSNIVVPVSRAYTTKAQFDQAFTDAAAAPQSLNSAPNREKLRNVGWKRLNISIASK
jgi:hypothetical protein